MRLAALDLLAFGHFSGETLRFADKTGAINIVYGDNEAGKSTSLRAISGFLFGIPVRTTDDFAHQKPTLRIGAQVISRDDQTVHLVRRKGAKGTLRDANDNPTDEDVLARMLGGLDRDLFEQMFALSRDALVSGGNDLLNGSGSLGEALFGASLGLAGINEILHALENEAAALFKPGGSNPTLNASVRELEELRRTVRYLELRPADFISHQTALETAQFQRTTVDGDLRRLHAEVARLERNRQLLPLAALRAQLQTQTEQLGKVVVLSTTAREERLTAVRDRDRADTDMVFAQDRIDALEAQLQPLRPNDALLERADEIRELHQDIGAHRKAARDLPGLRTQRRNALDEAAALLSQTHPTHSVEDIDDLRLTVALRTSITSLSEGFVRVDQAKRGADQRLTETRAKLTRARAEQAALPTVGDVSALAASLASARRAGDIESSIAEQEAEHCAADAQLRADLTGLSLFSGSIEELEHLPVPSLATLSRVEDAYEELASQQQGFDSTKIRLDAAAAKARERLTTLELTGVVPTEADLVAARSHRQRGWGLVRQSLDSETPVDDVDAFAEEKPLADAFETSMAAADEVADRLRREADRVAARAELDAAVESCDRELEELRTQLAGVAARRIQLDEEWAAIWQPTAITPLPPAEMRDWLQSRAALASEAASQREARGKLDGKIAVATRHRESLAHELLGIGAATGKPQTLAELVALAEDAVEENRSKIAIATKAREAVSALEDDERLAAQAFDNASTERSAWADDWASAVAQLSLDPSLKPDQVRAVVGALTDVFAKLDLAASFQNRIDAINRDTTAFAGAATALAQTVAPELQDLAPEQIVLDLHRLLNSSQTEAAQAGELHKQLDEVSELLRQAEDRRAASEAELQRLMKAANCSSLEALESAEEQSATAVDLRDRLKTVDERMTEIGTAPAAELAAEVAGLELEQLETDIVERAALIEEFAEHRRELDETVGQERALLAEMSRGEGAADAAAAVEAAKVDVREQAEQYARLRLAIAILRREIEKFREESHGPLLARASYIFAKLTCDGYSGFTTGFDDRGNVILLGRRTRGAEITVEQMSEGTRDQLYLALRLATIEQQVERSEPLPLIVDDLFVNFDDQRAAAGFEVLAEIAQKTQVIFFTHHRHLVDLAETTLKPDQWALQELGTANAGRHIQAA
jgi:uncharacterized protein YhaN